MTRRRREPARGGKGGAEPRIRIRERANRVLQLLIVGRTQHQIAAEVGVSQPAVSKIIKRAEERLLADLAPMVERWRVRHTLRLDHIFSEAMTAWTRSQEDGLRRRQRKSDGANGANGTVAELVSENRYGDPRFLEVARKALADSRELWGVNAPDRLAVSATAAFSSLSDAALATELERQEQIFQALAASRRDAIAGDPAETGGDDVQEA